MSRSTTDQITDQWTTTSRHDPSLEFHTLSTASTTRSLTVTVLVYCRCAQLYRGYGSGKGCEWVLCKDDVSATLRRNLEAWSLQNINAMSFTFPTTYLPKMTMLWKVSKMTFFFRCILILLAVKFQAAAEATSPTFSCVICRLERLVVNVCTLAV